MPTENPKKILLIEDENQFAIMVERLISRACGGDFIISWVGSLAEGLQALSGEAFDLVILDLNLPDSREMDSLEAILGHPRKAPVVVLTGIGDESLGAVALRRGATDYLLKTEMDQNRLIRTVEFAIERSRIASELEEYRTKLEYLVDQRTAKLDMEVYERKLAEENLKKALEVSQRKEDEVTALLHAAKAVMLHKHFPDAARVVFDLAKELIGATAGYVALLSPDGAENELLFLEAGGRACSVDPDLPMPIRGLRAEAYKKGITVYDNDFFHGAWMKFMPSGHVTLDNVLFAPLKIEGQTVGLMGLANKPGGFCENDLRLATAFGDIASVSLANSKVLDTLEGSEERHKALISSCPDPVVVYNPDGRVIDANPAFEKLFGWNVSEMKDMKLNFVPKDQIRDTAIAIKKMRSGLPVVRFETRRFAKNGKIIEVDISATDFRSAQDKLLGFVVFFRDITERKRLELSLKESEKTLRKILESINIGVVITDYKNHTIEYANPAALEMIGASQQEVIGKTCHQFICSAAKGKCPITDLGQEVDRAEKVLLTADGNELPVLKTVVCLDLGGRKRILESFLDTSEIKKAQDERLARCSLQAAIETAGAACHELNQPLQTIMNLTEAALEVIEPSHNAYQDLREIAQQTARMARITNKLQNITGYNTAEYSEGINILDLEKTNLGNHGSGEEE